MAGSLTFIHATLLQFIIINMHSCLPYQIVGEAKVLLDRDSISSSVYTFDTEDGIDGLDQNLFEVIILFLENIIILFRNADRL